jgi:hypothetical protein
MEWSSIRENFLYDLKRRPAGGRKRPSSAAESQTVVARNPTPLALHRTAATSSGSLPTN